MVPEDEAADISPIPCYCSWQSKSARRASFERIQVTIDALGLLMVGGRIPVSRARNVSTVSNAPAAPSK